MNKLDTNKVYYLASPYSHETDEMMQLRFEAIDKIAAKLCLDGLMLIEPISMCHQKSLKFEMPTGYEYWKTRDREFVKRADATLVAMLDGWKESIGVTDEIAYSIELGHDVLYLNPADFLTIEEIEKLRGIE